MPRTRIKICGITRPEDGLCAARYGADAIGLVFYPASPRVVNIDQARIIASKLPPFVMKVGVFVDADYAEIDEIVKQLKPDILQFHGNESEADCNRYACPYIKAIRMHEAINIEAEMNRFPGASAFLLDTHVPGMAGGTGASFDWSRVPENLDKPIIIAGGLDAENVKEAISSTWPYAVDVSGGVESGKGIKDEGKIKQFVSSVHNAVL